MRQRIAHGAAIDAATPDEVSAILSRLHQHEDQEHHREKGAIQLGATGAGSQRVNVSRMFNWRMERVTIGGAGAVNALVAIFDNSPASDADMLEVISPGATGRYSDAFSNSLWVPAGNQLVVTVTGGVANGQVTFNFQVLMIPVPGKGNANA